MTSMGYDAVLAVHVLAGFVGFGSIGLTGYFASLARSQPESTTVRRYFRPGTNWTSRAVFVVPIAGLALVYMGRDPGAQARQAWVLAGFAIWVAASALAAAVLWPAERRLQVLIDRRDLDHDAAAMNELCRRIAATAALLDLLYVAAVWLMVAKPA
jgi:uncharacterized membrane protein